MFEEEVKDALNTFNEYYNLDSKSPKEHLDDDIDATINDVKDKDIYKDLKEQYALFQYHVKQNEIFAGSEYISIIKSNTITFFKKYKMYTPIINFFMGFLCFYDEDYSNAQTYFLKNDDYLSAFLVCVKQLETDDTPEIRENAFNLATKELNFECINNDKSSSYINLYVFKFLMNYCNDNNDYSNIVYLIDTMYSQPFKKNEKFENFYYSLIELSRIKEIDLKFSNSKDFFSKENFQTICMQIKKHLSRDNSVHQDIVLSFEEMIEKGEELKLQKDFTGAESLFRDAITRSINSRQKQKAFKELLNLYKNNDYAKTLSIINEYFDADVFESDYNRYYDKSQMLIFTNSPHKDIYESITMLIQCLQLHERKLRNWNEPIISCMDLLKNYILNLLKAHNFDNAHTMCKLGLNLRQQIRKGDSTTEKYLKFFSKIQTECGKVKKDLAKKGTAKIIEPTVKMNNTISSEQSISKDPDNLPIFKFNPSGLLQYIEVSSLEDYEQYISDYSVTTKKLNQDGISKKILKLITNVRISEYIKSIYIVDDYFIGTPLQARKDIDFYLQSNIRKTFEKKRDEYLSLAKIVTNVIDNYGEDDETNITVNTKKEYIMYAMLYHSKCVTSEESKRYYLNIARLIYAKLYGSFSFDERSLATYESE